MTTTGLDHVSRNGLVWEWCDFWKCWQRDSHKYKIYPCAEGGYQVSSNQCWHDGHFLTFEDAEFDVLGSDGVSTREGE